MSSIMVKSNMVQLDLRIISTLQFWQACAMTCKYLVSKHEMLPITLVNKNWDSRPWISGAQAQDSKPGLLHHPDNFACWHNLAWQVQTSIQKVATGVSKTRILWGCLLEYILMKSCCGPRKYENKEHISPR